ncbi:MAG: hypothetical protein QGH60_03800 [Phycisphaerae bacterium]|nr:hypothetical protein [Phycisphaerae bacterium]
MAQIRGDTSIVESADTKTLKNFRIFSAIFWLLAPVLSYLCPLFTGRGHKGALECFGIVNAGPTSWLIVRFLPAGLAVFDAAIVVSMIFLSFLIWMCAKGMGIKAWLFLIVWYASNIFLIDVVIQMIQTVIRVELHP